MELRHDCRTDADPTGETTNVGEAANKKVTAPNGRQEEVYWRSIPRQEND